MNRTRRAPKLMTDREYYELWLKQPAKYCNVCFRKQQFDQYRFSKDCIAGCSGSFVEMSEQDAKALYTKYVEYTAENLLEKSL